MTVARHDLQATAPARPERLPWRATRDVAVREALVLCGLTAGLVLAFLLSLALGSTHVPVGSVIEVLADDSAAHRPSATAPRSSSRRSACRDR